MVAASEPVAGDNVERREGEKGEAEGDEQDVEHDPISTRRFRLAPIVRRRAI
jgi:hypothetical protein